jgi:hypothetical protein
MNTQNTHMNTQNTHMNTQNTHMNTQNTHEHSKHTLSKSHYMHTHITEIKIQTPSVYVRLPDYPLYSNIVFSVIPFRKIRSSPALFAPAILLLYDIQYLKHSVYKHNIDCYVCILCMCMSTCVFVRVCFIYM